MKNLVRKQSQLMKISSQKDFQIAFMALLLVLMIAPLAHAIVAPAAGSFAFDVYDIGVTKILKGPIGFVSGLFAIVYGAYMAIQGEFMYAVPAILGAGILLKADTVVSSLGAMM